MSNVKSNEIFLTAAKGAGYEVIDSEACSRRTPALHVSNVPTAVNDATADTAIFLMLGALRNFGLPMDKIHQGLWRGR